MVLHKQGDERQEQGQHVHNRSNSAGCQASPLPWMVLTLHKECCVYKYT